MVDGRCTGYRYRGCSAYVPGFPVLVGDCSRKGMGTGVVRGRDRVGVGLRPRRQKSYIYRLATVFGGEATGHGFHDPAEAAVVVGYDGHRDRVAGGHRRLRERPCGGRRGRRPRCTGYRYRGCSAYVPGFPVLVGDCSRKGMGTGVVRGRDRVGVGLRPRRQKSYIYRLATVFGGEAAGHGFHDPAEAAVVVGYDGHRDRVAGGHRRLRERPCGAVIRGIRAPRGQQPQAAEGYPGDCSYYQQD